MKILVLIKEVPDMARVRFDSEKGTVDRSSAAAEINPFDLNALQAAVDMKKQRDCLVTVLTMGPPRAENSLRDAYARGADRGILLTDRAFGGADTLSTSRTLAAAIRAMGSFDLILCGEKSVDGDTAQVGPEVAELLAMPHACYVDSIDELQEGRILVTTDNICGNRQQRALSYPALLSVTKNVNTVQMPSLKRKLESLRTEIEIRHMDDLKPYLTETETGGKGSPTKVVRIEVPKALEKKAIIYRENEKNEFFSFFSKTVRGLI